MEFFLNKLSLVFLLLSTTIFSQNYQVLNQFGSFTDATSFALSPQGYFYVTDNGSDEIYKIDSLGNVVASFGGYGWENGQFDYPIDISVNALNIFITDKNNHAIQRFDKDLNFLFRLYTRDDDNKDEAFGFPLSADASTMGDLFILDSENKRILKFDLFGKFIMQFGGFDAGEFSIKDPKKLIVTENNYILVLDGKNLIVFDLFGNGITKKPLPEIFSSIDKYYNTVTLTGDSAIYISNWEANNLSLTKLTLSKLPRNTIFTSSFVADNKVYALTKNSIYCFGLSEK